MHAKCKCLEFVCFVLSTPTSPSRTRPKTGLGVIGDEPCRLNGTTQALGEPVEANHLRRTIHRVPRGSHPPDRPGGLTLPLRPSASHHRQRIPVRQLSEDYLVPDNLGQHPGPGLVTPYLNRRGAHSKHMPQASILYWVAKSSRASLMPSRGFICMPKRMVRCWDLPPSTVKRTIPAVASNSLQYIHMHAHTELNRLSMYMYLLSFYLSPLTLSNEL